MMVTLSTQWSNPEPMSKLRQALSLSSHIYSVTVPVNVAS